MTYRKGNGNTIFQNFVIDEPRVLNLSSTISDYNNFEVGAAYDINVSDLNRATKYQGGFEIYFNYIFALWIYYTYI